MSELKPCPKCNGPATMIEGSHDYDGGDRYYAFSAEFVCAECGLSFKVDNDYPKKFGPYESMWDFAIEAWNARVEPEQGFDDFLREIYGWAFAGLEGCDGDEWELFNAILRAIAKYRRATSGN